MLRFVLAAGVIGAALGSATPAVAACKQWAVQKVIVRYDTVVQPNPACAHRDARTCRPPFVRVSIPIYNTRSYCARP